LYQVLQAKDKFVEAQAFETELEEEIEGMLARITGGSMCTFVPVKQVN
jgi:hypothetical protein